MVDPKLMQKFKVTEEDLASTPPRVIASVMALAEELGTLRKRIEEQDVRLNRNSSNSSKPSSSDKPYQKKSTGEKTGRPGAKHGHKGCQQALVEPTEKKELKPDTCSSCGCSAFGDVTHYYTHQWIELPPIQPDVVHFILYKGRCTCCGKVNRAVVPLENRTGYGPRISSAIAEIAGNQGDSRSTVQHFCASVLGFHISLGAVQKVLDRALISIV